MNSDFIIRTTESFDKSVKKLYKKYPSLIKDLQILKVQLLENPTGGIPLGKDCYKIRMTIASKNKGKSGGARVITYVKIENKLITLLDVYDKSEKDSISEKELAALIKKAG
jgi:mRNA-degrading endonuclease RelE of RelBE toxin-antitoxin system